MQVLLQLAFLYSQCTAAAPDTTGMCEHMEGCSVFAATICMHLTSLAHLIVALLDIVGQAWQSLQPFATQYHLELPATPLVSRATACAMTRELATAVTPVSRLQTVTMPSDQHHRAWHRHVYANKCKLLGLPIATTEHDLRSTGPVRAAVSYYSAKLSGSGAM